MSMAEAGRTFSEVKDAILSAHKESTVEDKIGFYNNWAENYEQDVAILDYRAPSLAAECLSAAFQADRGKALVLDVACGTGLVSTLLQKKGFQNFAGVDGSEKMLQLAKSKGLFQDLKQWILGSAPLPVPAESYDAVVIVGALGVGHVPLSVVKELWQAAKPGGYVCMTTRGNTSNKEFKAQLECLLKEMEREGLWVCVSVTEVEDWEKAVSADETGYIPGSVYLYRKSTQ
ncbi:methyltransferase-like protein 27 isoform X1 [Lepisosteus oculatus]|uniref:methyltransferase-like protein 27 isoform X1 n=1 Tax=Lepisosteus oculatus TaxID=7918 RepID=UPI0037168FF8